MQPKLQISAGVEYDFEPKSTYGARYQRVATPSVRIGVLYVFERIDRTRPKSHSFIVQLEFTSTFEGFKSRWMMNPVCRYFSALAIW